MATAVAIASVISTAAVAIVVTLLTSRAEARRAKWQANFSRFDELRSVLDGAVIALADAIYEANGVLSMLEQELGDRDDRLTQLKTLEGKLNDSGQYKERIALRMGRNAPLSVRYNDAYLACFNAWHTFVEVIWQGQEFGKPLRRRANDLISHAGDLHTAFIEEASALVGPDLAEAAG